MPSPSTSIQFARKRSVTLPWQEPYFKTDESTVPDLLKQGYELSVQGPEQSEPLPMVSPQDLDEFYSFQKGEIFPTLAEPRLAQNLLNLRDRGASFFSQKPNHPERQKVGAYGAYNLLTDQSMKLAGATSAIDILEVAFAQPLPSVKLDSQQQLSNITEVVEVVDQMVASSPDEHRLLHRAALLSGAFDKPHLREPLELAQIAASRLPADVWDKKSGDLGALGSLFAGFEQLKPRAKVVSDTLLALDANGEKIIKNIKSAVALYAVALAEPESDDKFLLAARDAVQPADKKVVTASLGRALFPDKIKQSEDFVAQVPEQFREAILDAVFEASVPLDLKEDVSQLAEPTLKLLKSRKANSELLTTARLAFANRLAGSNPRVKEALEFANQTNSDGKRVVSNAGIDVLLEESVKPGISAEEYAKNIREGMPKEDKGAALQFLVRSFAPKMEPKIADWTSHLDKETQDWGVNQWREIVLDSKGVEEPHILLEEVSKKLDSRQNGFEYVNRLYRSVVESRQGEARADFALKAVSSPDPKSNPKIRQHASQRAFLKAALTPNLDEEKLITTILENVHKSEKVVSQEILLSEFLPQRREAVDTLMDFSPEKEKAVYYRYFLQSALKPGNETLPNIASDSIRQAQEEKSDHLHILRRIVALQRGLTDQKADLLLEISDSRGPGRTSKWKSVYALYDFASRPIESDKALYEGLLKDVDTTDTVFVRRNLAKGLFPKLADRVDALTRYSEFEEESDDWDALFRAAYENPDIKDPARLVEKATASLTEAETHVRFANRLRKLALKATAPTNPRSRLILHSAQDSQGQWQVKKLASVTALYKAGVEPYLSDGDLLVSVIDNADQVDRASLLSRLGGVFLGQPGLEVPTDIMARFDKGELSAPEIREVLLTLQGVQNTDSGTQIDVEEDRIVIGGQALEVDL